ncbi:MAG: hypothetical protein HQK84_05640 [Nitrospinae bacterium]|nr:hypothetical protein [Nitrospinota bacterium]
MSKEYLKNDRLGEVVALIQVLAFHQYTSRSEEGLMKELKRKPSSSSSWMELGKSHPELFRVRDDDPDENKVDRVSLVSRYVQPYVVENKKRIRQPLSDEIVHKLIGVALDIHDRQASRADKWKVLIPMGVSIISAGAAITAALIKTTP